MSTWFRKIYLRFRHSIRSLIRFVCYFSAFFIAALTYWIGANFGEPPLEQVLYHMQFGQEGLMDTDQVLIADFVHTCIRLPFLMALVIVLVDTMLAWYLARREQHASVGWFRRLHSLLRGVYWLIGHRAPIYVLLGSIVYFCAHFAVMDFFHHRFGPDYFAAHYVDPQQIEVKPRAPKNLVIIYVESLENSYREERLFGRNLLKSLDDLGGVSFGQYRQAPGTGWTIAGITATQCGLPLKSLSLYDSNGTGEIIKNFLPRAVCLGDVLAKFGYHNVYMGGDALPFSGKGKFFRDHHYQETYGRDELKGNLTAEQMNYWGLYDHDLMGHAKQKLLELKSSKKPFNFVMTTIDTHGPDGHYSESCKQKGVKDFPGVVECAANHVTALVKWLKANGFMENTQIVVLGDHLAMVNPVYEKINQVGERHIYIRLISKEHVAKGRDDILHFDMFPTILEFAGFEVTGGRLGLGYSAINQQLRPPENTLQEMEADLLNNSERYLQLWKPVSNG